MKVVKLKKPTSLVGLTTLDPALAIPMNVQQGVIEDWGKKLGKMLVIGPSAPNAANGLRHVPSGSLPPIQNLLRTYMLSIPGTEVLVLARPNYFLNDLQPVRDFAKVKGFEVMWGCHQSLENKPQLFVLSSPVVSHMLNELPPEVTFMHNWEDWVHSWMTRLLRQRYFDASEFKMGVQVEAEASIPEAKKESLKVKEDINDLSLYEKSKRRPVLKRVKINQ